jgi:hypothetical protein
MERKTSKASLLSRMSSRVSFRRPLGMKKTERNGQADGSGRKKRAEEQDGSGSKKKS